MSTFVAERPEIIESTNVLHRGDVAKVESAGEIIKIKAAIWLAVASLGVAFVILVVGVYTGKSDLQSWATGLISGIAGAAIAYGFNRSA